MAIRFNTGTTFSTNTTSATQTITIPAGVNQGDVIVVVVSQYNTNVVQSITASSTGTAPVQIGSTVSTASFSSFILNSALFYVVAGPSDAGKVITVGTVSGTSSSKWAMALGAWSGASNLAPVDVSGSAVATGSGASITCPSETTGVAGDWDLQIFSGALGGATFSGGAGFTQRESVVNASSGEAAAIYDSNVDVGASGTTIGGAVFTNAGHNNWWVGWTVGLAPAPVISSVSRPAPRRRLSRAVVQFIPVVTTNASVATPPAGTVQPLGTVPVPRRRLSRAVVQFIPVVTVNAASGPAGTVQPRAVPAAMPRRRPGRAVVQFIPVTTTNNVTPPVPFIPHTGGGKSMLSRYMRWADL